MASRNYAYETSPRKQELYENYKLRIVEQNKKKKEERTRKAKKNLKEKLSSKQARGYFLVVTVFAVLFTISYRNSVINETFKKNQDQKEELSVMQKENEQARINIENGLNLNNIEKQAKEKLGMQKLTTNQTKYVSLPKKDYTEPVKEEIKLQEEPNMFEEILEILGSVF